LYILIVLCEPLRKITTIYNRMDKCCVSCCDKNVKSLSHVYKLTKIRCDLQSRMHGIYYEHNKKRTLIGSVLFSTRTDRCKGGGLASNFKAKTEEITGQPMRQGPVIFSCSQ